MAVQKIHQTGNETFQDQFNLCQILHSIFLNLVWVINKIWRKKNKIPQKLYYLLWCSSFWEMCQTMSHKIFCLGDENYFNTALWFSLFCFPPKLDDYNEAETSTGKLHTSSHDPPKKRYQNPLKTYNIWKNIYLILLSVLIIS